MSDTIELRSNFEDTPTGKAKLWQQEMAAWEQDVKKSLHHLTGDPSYIVIGITIAPAHIDSRHLAKENVLNKRGIRPEKIQPGVI